MFSFLKIRGLRETISLLVILALALTPPICALLDNSFYVGVVNNMMIFAVAAVALNLILGYGGMISFGHAAYIGIGAYCVGIPAYYDMTNGWLHLAYTIFFCGAFAFVTGAISLRTKGVHFIMITMAFAQMAFYAFISLEEYGGDDGLVIYDRSVFTSLIDLEDDLVFYYVTLAVLLGVVVITWQIMRSRFGMVIKGAKGNEARMKALGFNCYAYRLTAYVISGILCGLAGMLLANRDLFISPEIMDWTRSGELMFMVILGGTGSLFGPILGAGVFKILEEVLSNIWHHWHLIFGVFLVAVVLYAPKGLDSLMDIGKKKND